MEKDELYMNRFLRYFAAHGKCTLKIFDKKCRKFRNWSIFRHFSIFGDFLNFKINSNN